MSYYVLVHPSGRVSKHTDINRELWERRNARLHPEIRNRHKVKIIDCSSEEEADEVMAEYQSKGKVKHKPVPKKKASGKPKEGENQ